MSTPIRKGAPQRPFGDRRSGRTQVDRRHPAALALLKLVSELLALVETVHAGPLDGGDVDENVRASARRLDKPIALLGVEPFDRTGRHQQELQLVERPPQFMRRIDFRLDRRTRTNFRRRTPPVPPNPNGSTRN